MNPFHAAKNFNTSRYASGPPIPTPMWNTLMPDSLNGSRSVAVNVSGLANHLLPFGKSSVNGLSISITVDRFTRSTARAEYSFDDGPNIRNRPRLIIAGAMRAKLAPAADFSSWRRVILLDSEKRGI